MRLKPLLAAILALGGLASGQAMANYTCTLGFVSPSGTNPVHVGQQFGFSVLVSFVDFGPYPPISYKPFEVHFHGTRNGVGIPAAASTSPTSPATTKKTS